MITNKISRVEIAVLVLMFIMLVAGFVLVFISVPLFEWYTVEDGLVEWLTVAGLLLGAFTCFIRIVRLRTNKSWLFLFVTLMLGLVLFFGAGEEISWGQRIFGIQSPEYFKEHNTQGETNIHNLILDGVRLNRWIFSILLSIVLGIYVIVIPLLYRSKKWMQRIVDYWGIPLPKMFQTIALLVMAFLTQLIPHGKRAELLECGIALMLFLIIRFPANETTFKR
ncbi:MAG: hypothetical protein ICV65_15935 [Flavisolibacter sp.]|nr:hypothetical protein [Flavisolibacter sp.]